MSHSDSDSDNEKWSDEIDNALHNLTDDMNQYFLWREATNRRLDDIEERLDNIWEGMNAIHNVIVAPNQNIGNNNVVGTGGGKRRKRTRRRKKSRKKSRKRKRR